ncbi:MAG: helix-turn-helix domain-containing protein [Bryobacteraceae bacterium]
MAEQTPVSRTLRTRPDLVAIRRSKGITLDQIVDATKISKRFLVAIEEGNFAQLPGGIFNTSYIRQYARAIDYDESDLLAYYRVATGIAEQEDETGSPDGKKGLSKILRRPVLARF